jgi:ferredoxin/flavodoxin---NADP+ reductase
VSTQRVAIVGAGPAGFYTAQPLLEHGIHVDLIDRLPTPHGLVRSGVAPDHPKIKAVSRVFETILDHENLRFFGNVEIGEEFTLDDLRDMYDAVVLATGASVGRHLGIEGEALTNSLSAADVVPWYNGHPDYTEFEIDLGVERAIVMGAGNVAMDVARMLALPVEELQSTDTADHALALLAKSSITEVVIAARRGPEHVAFTPPELRELAKLEHVDVDINPKDIQDARARMESVGEIPKEIRQNLDALEGLALQEKKGAPRTIRFAFFHTPTRVLGTSRVEGVEFSGVIDETIPCGLFITAIGYDGQIDNIGGRIEDGLFCVGWAKRGPTGVIGTNKRDGSEVAEAVLDFLSTSTTTPQRSIDTHLATHQVVDRDGWRRIDSAETQSGEKVGRPRVKYTDREEMVALGSARD